MLLPQISENKRRHVDQWNSTHFPDTTKTKDIHIKVILFYKQNMIFDMLADIFNSETNNNCVIGNVHQVSGFCLVGRKLWVR